VRICQVAELGSLRARVERWALGAGCSPAEAHRVVLVADELATNALRAAPIGTPVRVVWRRGTAGVTVTVTGRGPKWTGSAPMPDSGGCGQETGRGLAIVDALATRVVRRRFGHTVSIAHLLPSVTAPGADGRLPGKMPVNPV
jgi:anti-sigma regulatory factor (Ser/Thr protein kinase)